MPSEIIAREPFEKGIRLRTRLTSVSERSEEIAVTRSADGRSVVIANWESIIGGRIKTILILPPDEARLIASLMYREAAAIEAELTSSDTEEA